MDFLQLAAGDFGINGGGLQLLVSEQLLDVADAPRSTSSFARVRSGVLSGSELRFPGSVSGRHGSAGDGGRRGARAGHSN